jgi:DNA-binding winged helix-turn-helix (wHTH) protein
MDQSSLPVAGRGELEFRLRSQYTPVAASPMRDEFPAATQLRFDSYHVDLRTGELRKHGRKIRLAGRPFQILALLLEQPGELLTRKQLQQRLWPADAFVDFEHGVNAAVRMLRRALCDSHQKPRYIETLLRRGYRFVAAVERVQSSSEPAPAVPACDNQQTTAVPRSECVGQVATIQDGAGRNYVLLPVSEELLAEMTDCKAAKDELGIPLLSLPKNFFWSTVEQESKFSTRVIQSSAVRFESSEVNSSARKRSHPAPIFSGFRSAVK